MAFSDSVVAKWERGTICCGQRSGRTVRTEVLFRTTALRNCRDRRAIHEAWFLEPLREANRCDVMKLTHRLLLGIARIPELFPDRRASIGIGAVL
jgi:hypothetical protein